MLECSAHGRILVLICSSSETYMKVLHVGKLQMHKKDWWRNRVKLQGGWASQCAILDSSTWSFVAKKLS